MSDKRPSLVCVLGCGVFSSAWELTFSVKELSEGKSNRDPCILNLCYLQVVGGQRVLLSPRGTAGRELPETGPGWALARLEGPVEEYFITEWER